MFKINDKITFLDETGIYTVVEMLSNNEIRVEDEHGFDRICREREIVLFESSAFDGVEIETFENRNHRTNPFAKKRKKSIQVPIIDLHIEHLLDAHGHMANHEIVLFQLDCCKRELDKHIEKGTTQLVIIHGVGKGRLKEEVRYMLNSYPNIEYMDEHYSENGIGATKVFIK
ncbi:MAG: Smr/MutS family protein [Flavobacteriales bacterium]